MSMSHRVFVVLLLAFFWHAENFHGVQSLKIKVVEVDGGALRKHFTDSSAAFQDRSYLLPNKEKDAIKGPLIYPNPRNACSPVEPSPNDTVIAYLDEYTTCPDRAEANLKRAGFVAMLAHTQDSSASLDKKEFIPQALITDSWFAVYLKEYVIPGTSGSVDLEVVMWDDSYAKIEQLFIIFGIILLVAVFLSICIFCSSLFGRMALVKWRTRCLSSWQVRALPKRKFRKAKEATETCSICLEEFKEGETVRVLPCDHVFHPKCVDEWLQKWNRTCPLCKSTIKKKKGGKTQNPPAQTDDVETSLLLPQESLVDDASQTDGENCGNNYGATGVTTVFQNQRHHRRGPSASSHTSSNSSHAGQKNQVTSAEIELSGSGQDGRCSTSHSLYHTPLHSDEEELTPSFTTAYGSHSSIALASEQV